LRDKISQYKRANGSSALGNIWLPHDARNKTFAAKYSAVEIFLKYFGASHVKITPDSKKADRVNAARRIIQRCEFSDKCEKGLEGLSAWSYIWDEERRIFSSDPDHNWASHDGDGFSYGCLIAEQIKPKEPEKPAKFNIKAQNGVIITAPLDELWQDVKRPQERY
jgi:phage terminase large subunit